VRFGPGGCGIVAHAELHPHDFGADRYRLVDGVARRLAAAKDIDHVDRLQHLGGRERHPPCCSERPS